MSGTADIGLPCMVYEELERYGIPAEDVRLIRSKEGVTVARAAFAGGSAVLKCFETQDFRREIYNYRLLRTLDVPTIGVFGSTDRSILLEDLARSGEYRLAEEEDMNDPAVVAALAKWYSKLHTAGAEYVRLKGEGLYSEGDLISEENLNAVGERFGLKGTKGFLALKDAFPTIEGLFRNAPKTLTYNDFYYTNLAVKRDKTAALMFDFNLLGKGLYVSDVRNVGYQLTEENRRLFAEEYGGADERLMLLDEALSPLVSLVSAMQRDIFPPWAEEALEEFGRLPELIKRIL